ncbi:hypothetical protein AAE478_002245 [Parahypoxylon ruwenzoriense]
MPVGAPGQDASRRPFSGILMSSPEALLSRSHDVADVAAVASVASVASRGQKRKRDAEAMEDLLKPSIVVKPHPPNLAVRPRSLQPLMLLPREHIQLSFLDLSSPYGSFEYSRFFESTIKILDLEGRMGSVVLIARLETDKTLYVLERQKDGLYTLCQFGSWVDLQELEQFATVSCPWLIEKRSNTSRNSSISHPLTTPQLHHETKKRKLAIEAIQSLVKRPARSRSVSTPSQCVPPTEWPAPGQDNGESQPKRIHATSMRETQSPSQTARVSEADEVFATPTADGIFGNIRYQYLESLYLSMGSLAYFAKGPLSRARAAFHLDCDSNLEMNDLIDFLKGLVMTTVQIDKKYRETIPDIISKMKPVFQDSDAEQGTAKTRKRKTKKMKLGKDSLYPMEDEHVRKWWTAHRPQLEDDEVMTAAEPHETKLQIAFLRSRETQLQMIIILEILALEPLVKAENGKDSQLPGIVTPKKDAAEISKDVPDKKRNRHNLPSLLDIHADRLCIWQSTALDEVKLPGDSHMSKGQETQKASRTTSDPLKDFCIDIIVPFFSARLSEQCDSLNRKLGGPVMMAPSNSKPKKPESATKPKAKPSLTKSSSVAKHSAFSKSHVTLERVLSKETERHRRSMSRGPSGVIALMRSASTPMLKREASEPLSMISIPKADSATSQEKATRASGSISIKRRSEEEKAKKEALVKAELQDAIFALRRPNREVVGKAMAEAAERRATTSLSQLKKSRKPTQHPPTQNIVKATPIGSRFVDVLGKGVGNQPIRSRDTGSPEAGHIPSSSLIPSSAPRKRGREAAFAPNKSPAPTSSRKFADQIKATPSRPLHLKQSFLTIPEADDVPVFASSPVVSRQSSFRSFRDSGVEMPTSPMNELAETPIKPRVVPIPLEGLVAATPSKRKSPNKDTITATAEIATTKDGEDHGRRLSIFERLGWDDDFDELG